ncbi:MAG: aminotransferase class IV [Flavobacteriia bacterium]|nr:aminotransferase class IV [Flavobacteriia bacterium]
MINHNGEILDIDAVPFRADFRPTMYGDALFETIKYNGVKLINWEDHYFRAMASMRILRMEIPMEWSPEYLEEQVMETLRAAHLEANAARIRITLYRNGEGKYTPATTAEMGYFIMAEALPDADFELNKDGLSIDIYKDHEVPKSMLSNLKTTNSLLYSLAGIFARDNELDDVLLVNADKHVVEATASNVFMFANGKLITPPLETGALRGVMRKHILRNAKEWELEIEEKGFSPFDLQRADEVFLTNSITGIQWVANYRKKTYGNTMTKEIVDKLNASV